MLDRWLPQARLIVRSNRIYARARQYCEKRCGPLARSVRAAGTRTLLDCDGFSNRGNHIANTRSGTRLVPARPPSPLCARCRCTVGRMPTNASALVASWPVIDGWATPRTGPHCTAVYCAIQIGFLLASRTWFPPNRTGNITVFGVRSECRSCREPQMHSGARHWQRALRRRRPRVKSRSRRRSP